MLHSIRFTKTNFWISIFFIPIFLLSIKVIEFNSLLFLISMVILFKILGKTYNSPAFFLSIFSSLFYIPFFLFYFFDWQISVYQTFNTPENVREMGRVFFLFQYVFFCNLKKIKQYDSIPSRLRIHSNGIIFYVAISIAIFLMITSLSGETILSSTYGSQQKIGTPLYEYAIPFTLIAFIFSGRDKKKLLIIVGFIFIYLIKDLIFGGRISTIQMGLLFFILFLDKKVNFKFILLGSLGAFVFLKGFEVIRLSSELIQNPFNIDYKALFSLGSDIKIYGSFEGEVVHSSIRLIGMINDGILSTIERIDSFFLFIFSSFNPGMHLPPLANLTSFLQSEYPCGGGGLFPVYFYIWGGYLGVILSAVILSSILNQFFTTKNMFILIYTTMILVTFPRWFAYNPVILLKLSMIPLYIYLIIQQFYLFSKIKSNKNIQKNRINSQL